MDFYIIEAQANHMYAIRNPQGKTAFVGRKPWIDDVLDALNKAYNQGASDASV